MTSVQSIKSQILAATRAVVPAARGCIYDVGRDLTPHGHQTDSDDTRWLALYPRYRALDPFHPRYFAQLRNSVFRTRDGAGRVEQHRAYIDGFRQPMGMAFKAEVFLRDASDAIVAGIRLSRPYEMGEFRDDEVAVLQALQPVLSSAWQTALAQARIEPLLAPLTPREREVLTCLRTGCSNKEICRRLGMALPTTKSHVQRIMRKIGVTSRAELLAVLAGAQGRVGL